MNALDLVLALIILIYTLRGAHRGLFLGLIDVAGIITAVAVGFAGYKGPSPIIARVLRLPGDAADLAAFFTLFFLAVALYVLVSSGLQSLSGVRKRPRTSSRVTRVLGVVFGAIQGGVVAALLATAVGILPVSASLAAQSESSTLAPFLDGLTTRLAPSAERLLAFGPQPSLLRVHAPGNVEQVDPSFPDNLTVSDDQAAEQRMLELINQERAAHGMRPLTMDEQLRGTARAHSAEMFQLSYFSHHSPQSGATVDRLKAAGIAYLVAGENLAYQPDVVTAHRMLMSNAGHRSNILSPLFERIGIGVVRGGAYGQMFTQVFAD